MVCTMPKLRTETMTVNMGPQHPSTHGVLRLVLELDGETVRSMSPTIGYLHTGIEKTCAQKRWQQVIPLVERMDYMSSQYNSMAVQRWREAACWMALRRSTEITGVLQLEVP